MSLTTRTVYTPQGHGLFTPSGKPRAGVEVTFSLVERGPSFDLSAGDRVLDNLSVMTDANGEFSTPLWPNDRSSATATYYRCAVDGSEFSAYLASGASPITWSDFAATPVP